MKKVTFIAFSIIFQFLFGLEIFLLSQSVKIQPQRIFEKYRFSSIDKVVKYEDCYYVLEVLKHRVLIFDKRLVLKYGIGSIGQGKGELYYPENFVIRKGKIYIIDRGNTGSNRIQTFSIEGDFINSFKVDFLAYGFAVNSRGEIYLGQPDKGKLVTVYAKNGKVIKSFGRLHTMSDFYGDSFDGETDKESKDSINRVFLYIDEADYIYLSFVGAPFFQKYDPKCNLVFEKKISGEESDLILSGFKKNKESPIKRGIDHIPTPLITTGIAVDESTSNIIISFQWWIGWIYIADSEGNKLLTLQPPDKSMLFNNISVSKESQLFLPRLSVIKFNEAYVLDLKEYKNKLNKRRH